MDRIKKVQKLLKDYQLNALVIDQPIDLYYLLGQTFSLGRLVIEEQGATLFVDGRYFEKAHATLPFPVKLTAGYGEGSSFFKEWKFLKKRVGFDAEWTTYAAYEGMKQLASEWVAVRAPIKKLREIKEEEEIAALRDAAKLGSEGCDYVLSLLEEGISEQELVQKLKIFWLEAGAEGCGFEPHIAFGEATANPHYRSGKRKLAQGELVLIDIGVILDHYHSDMTRVVHYGKATKQFEELYQVVYDAYCAAVSFCSPGRPIAEVDRAARHFIEKKGLGECFSHGLGHGVGLEIHELPKISTLGIQQEGVLQEGMVITIEPGIYLPGIGGVRLEDTLLITSTGSLNLTQRPLSPTLPVLLGRL